MSHFKQNTYKFIKDSDDVRIGEVIKRDVSKCDLALLGVPWDGAVGTRPGSRLAPFKLRQYFYTAPYPGGIELADYGDVDVVVGNHEESWRRSVESIGVALNNSAETLVLGGDSTTSYCAFKALRNHVAEKILYIVFDAHPDVRKVSEGLTSGQVVRWVRDFDKDAQIIIIGVRRNSNAPYLFAEAKNLDVKLYTTEEVDRVGFGSILSELRAIGSESTVHVSVNMDVFDPGFAPGVNSPSPGGFYPREMLHFIDRLTRRLRPKVFDLVEMTPSYDHGDITAMLGSSVLLSSVWVTGSTA
jgi:agmatinase